MSFVGMVQMSIVQVVDVVAVANRGMPTIGTVNMVVMRMCIVLHGFSSECVSLRSWTLEMKRGACVGRQAFAVRSAPQRIFRTNGKTCREIARRLHKHRWSEGAKRNRLALVSRLA
jgi:hypothetical protein